MTWVTTHSNELQEVHIQKLHFLLSMRIHFFFNSGIVIFFENKGGTWRKFFKLDANYQLEKSVKTVIFPKEWKLPSPNYKNLKKNKTHAVSIFN